MASRSRSLFRQSTRRYELRLVDAAGEAPPRKLYDDPESGWLEPRDWSPDGKSIVVVVSRKDGTDRIGGVGRGRLVPYPSFRSMAGKHAGVLFARRQALRLRSPRKRFVAASGSVRVRGWLGPGNSCRGQARPGHHDGMVARRQAPALRQRSQRFAGALGYAVRQRQPEGAPELLKADLGNAEPLGVSQTGAFYYGLSSGMPGSNIHLASFDPATGKLSIAARCRTTFRNRSQTRTGRLTASSWRTSRSEAQANGQWLRSSSVRRKPTR